jgi:hypothetical protein
MSGLVVRSVVGHLVHHVAVTFNGAIIEQGEPTGRSPSHQTPTRSGC